MNLTEILRQAFATFRAHKMRIFLTMFGIVWGISSVILLVGLGRGFSADQKRRMQTLGKDLVIVWGGRTSSQIGGLAAGREISLTIDDARLIQKECYLVKNVSPELRRTMPDRQLAALLRASTPGQRGKNERSPQTHTDRPVCSV